MSEEVHEIRGIGDYVIDCYTEYGNYVNIHRHVPRWEDGLKPVYKRVMLCALDIACGKKVKTATLIGRTIGTYHPHGDAALNDVIAELVRSGLLIGQGNFGYKSMFRWDDNSPAAPRYTEVKVNPKYETLIKQLLPYVPSHINDLGNIEADYLPTPCVLSLAMGSFGIGLGVTVNIPSFTMESLIRAGYAAILGKPKPWKLLQPGFDLQMSDEDKETFWNNEKGRLTYKFDVEPKTIGGLNGWSIIGDPSFVKPKLQQLFKLKDEGGKVVDCGQCAVAIRRKRRYGKAAHNEHNRNHDGAVDAETFLDLTLHRQSFSI